MSPYQRVRSFAQHLIDYAVAGKHAAIGVAFLALSVCAIVATVAVVHPPGKPAVQQFGWAGPEIAAAEIERTKAEFPVFSFAGPINRSQRVCLWDAAFVVANGDTDAFQQLIGDCVGCGAKQAVEMLQLVSIAMTGQGTFRRVWHPYHYACGRNAPECGAGQLRRDPSGSLGVWQAKALQLYGVVYEDTPGIEPYSERTIKTWAVKMPGEHWVNLGRKNLIRTVSRITTVDEGIAAVTSGYPFTTASPWGGHMKCPVVHGRLLNEKADTWQHQMCCIGYDGDPETVRLFGEPLFLIRNSWGDAHGNPPDGSPPGSFWVRARDMAYMLRHDCWALSDMDGFEPRDWQLIRSKCERIRQRITEEKALFALANQED